MIKVLVYVQHLLGIGHLHRTALITAALADGDFEVTVISGGISESQVDFGKVNFIQLPAIKTDAAFSNLYDQKNKVVSDEFKRERCSQLISTYKKISPDVVLIETYPFGRRQMRFELLPLLQEINNSGSQRPIVLSSIRDVIQPKSNPKRTDEVIELISNNFDAVLVHGDQSFIRFDQSFPDAKRFSEKIFYTGYVAKPRLESDSSANQKNKQKNTILVSAGGGAVGKKLYQTAIDASKQSAGMAYEWHILVGNNISENEFNELVIHKTDNLLIERNRSDFIELMADCKISISQAGYNTIMDILITGAKSIVIPFEGEGEQEQLIRATTLEKKDVLSIIRESDLSVRQLLKNIEQVKSESQPQRAAISMDGAAQTAKLIKQIRSGKTEK